jgi:hypothetical protein
MAARVQSFFAEESYDAILKGAEDGKRPLGQDSGARGRAFG